MTALLTIGGEKRGLLTISTISHATVNGCKIEKHLPKTEAAQNRYKSVSDQT